MTSKTMNELCECAFEQGYGKYSHRASDFKWLPSLTLKTYARLQEIANEDLK